MTNGSFESSEPGALPPFPGGIDPDALDFLTDTRWEDIPNADAFVINCSTWRRTIATEGPTPELIAEVHAAFAEQEETHPSTHAWDALRAYIADHLFANHTEDSLDVIYGMRSFHIMVRTIRDLSARADRRTGDAISRSFMRRFTVDPDSSRLRRFDQAYYDTLIREDPDSPVITSLESELAAFEPGYDPVTSWARSQQELRPSLNAQGIADLVRNDSVWANVPTRWRQNQMARHFDRLNLLRAADPERIQQMIADLNAMHNLYPEASMWDDFKSGLVVGAANRKNPGLALEFGRSIRSAEAQQTMVVFLLEQGYEQEAFGLTNAMTDDDVLAHTLLHAAWSEARGLSRLHQIINDTAEPIGRRIVCAKKLRDRMAEIGENTAPYDESVIVLEMERDLLG